MPQHIEFGSRWASGRAAASPRRCISRSVGNDAEIYRDLTYHDISADVVERPPGFHRRTIAGSHAILASAATITYCHGYITRLSFQEPLHIASSRRLRDFQSRLQKYIIFLGRHDLMLYNFFTTSLYFAMQAGASRRRPQTISGALMLTIISFAFYFVSRATFHRGF